MGTESQNIVNSLQVEFTLARFAENKGKTERAVAGYRRILSIQPDHLPTLRVFGELLLKLKYYKAAAEHFQKALAFYPNNELLHKYLVTSLIAENDLEAPFVYYQLTRIDSNNLKVKNDEVLACVVVRNEYPRVPFFLEYYRQKGIKKFFFVDNLSTDGTIEYLKLQPDVFLWQTPFSFKKANFGSAWFEVLMRKFGIGHWILTVDADELLYYPNAENKSIPELCSDLEDEKKKAYPTILLDMYSDKSLKTTNYSAGESFLDVCPFFDREFFHREYEEAGEYKNQTFYFGGMRERIFGKSGDFMLNKIPLLKYDSEVVLAGGQHFTNLPAADISDERGCLLHFKYFDFFADYVRQEVKRNEHACEAMQYHQYHQILATTDEVVFYDQAHSIRFQDSRQLVDLGIMKSIAEPEILHVEFPKIHPVVSNEERPFWSIKITAYRRFRFLKNLLERVLEATRNCADCEIEVINDAAEPEIQDQIKAIIDEAGKGKITYYSSAQNLGHPNIFNLCIDRARGEWVHILHDDDLIHPDFYELLEAGIASNPEIGAAFCRFNYIDENGTELRVSQLERETAGIVDNWLERIATHCRVQFPAIVVKREVYEKVGGYCPEAESAFDWEMWKRIGAAFPVWFEPRNLASFREHSEALSYELIRSGKQIADSRKTIPISNRYLPIEKRKFLSWWAKNELALFAVNQAKRQIEIGYKHGAEANLREALICSQIPSVKKAVNDLAEEYNLEIL